MSTSAPQDLSAQALEARLAALTQALDECVAEVPASLAIPARSRLDTVAERLALGVDHTVVAFFGGTGSGKSSLFNALTHLDFADVGARRPTTSRAAACTWGDSASALLTFLGVDEERRIRRESALDGNDEDDLRGLVLLDVPDYDSVTREHALQVDRLVPLADILIWVLDPQKYADAALHDGYLSNLGARSEDILVLVNHIDTVPQAGCEQLLSDVRELLVADGLADVPVLPVSALHGENVGRLREIVVERVAEQSHAARTADAELRQIAQRLAPAAAAHEVSTGEAEETELVRALTVACGARAVADSIAVNLARLIPGVLVRPEAASDEVVAAARSRFLVGVTGTLPSVWRHSVESAVVGSEALAGQISEAVGSVRLPASRAMGQWLAWWLGCLAVVAGLVLGGFAVAGGRGMGLAIAGAGLVVAGCLIALLARDRRRRRAELERERYLRAVDERMSAVVARSVIQPADGVLERHERLREVLTRS